MKKFSILVFFVFSIFLFGCGATQQQKENKKLTIVTSIVPLYSFVKNIVGDKADVFNLIPPGASEHLWEAKPSDIINLSKADLYIKNGAGLEDYLNGFIESAGNKKLTIMEASKTIPLSNPFELVELEEGEGEHENETVDPHVWLSPKLAKIEVQNIVEEVVKLDPSNKDFYIQNAKNYTEKLDNLDKEIADKFDKVSKKDFIVFHDAYQYFLRDYGLLGNMKAAIEEFPGKEPSQAYLKKLVDLIKNNGVNIVFTEPQFSPKVVETLKSELGIKTYELNPLGSDLTAESYEKNINAIVNSFVESFK